MSATLFVTLFGLAACEASDPIGFLKQGDTIAVVIGWQCGDSRYFVNHVRVENYDRAKSAPVQPPLWEIQFDESSGGSLRDLPKIEVGTVPEGFTEVADNIATQGIGATLDLKVWAGDHLYAALLDTDKFRDGKVLDADRQTMSEKEFTDRWVCSSGAAVPTTASALD